MEKSGPAPRDNLQQIDDRLTRGDSPSQVIGQLTPAARQDAVSWARQLPYFDELRGHFRNQVIAIARTVSKCGMTAFGLAFSGDGRVVERTVENGRRTEPRPTADFILQIQGGEVRVRYT